LVQQTNKHMTARGVAETRCGCDSYPSVLPVGTAGTVLCGWKSGLRVLWKSGLRLLWKSGLTVLWKSELTVLWKSGLRVMWKSGLTVLWKTATSEWGTGENYITRSLVKSTAHQIL
jgi:hypothetical protein